MGARPGLGLGIGLEGAASAAPTSNNRIGRVIASAAKNVASEARLARGRGSVRTEGAGAKACGETAIVFMNRA